ncbi:MAG: hypothetical protein DRJ66_00805 [Thermoprotei archaeon]|nr:MAG: hypothetical protein DRJ66_00805 [Thermoprotei archaeon]RLF20120.1 MAG: hypothetical protein DRZ82_03255 [Thermoprotei archaeon]
MRIGGGDMSFEERIDEIFERIRREVRRFLEDIERYFELEQPMWCYETRSLEPLFTITETEEELIVTFDLPMVDKDSIKINATEESLEVEAKLRRAVPGPRYLGSEVCFEKFRKTIRLPVKVDPRGARARYKDGILEIRFPKLSQRRFHIRVT